MQQRLETTQDVTVSSSSEGNNATDAGEPEETTRSDLGAGEKGWGQDRFNRPATVQSFQAIESTIKAYTTYTLSAFRQVAIANVEKVTLEFGIEIGGEAGVPYVTKGTAKSNLKITVECSFPKTEA